jgi:hypothetical protein
MPVRHIKEHPATRLNTDGSKTRVQKFTNVDQIRSCLRSQSQEELVEGQFLFTTEVADL